MKINEKEINDIIEKRLTEEELIAELKKTEADLFKDFDNADSESAEIKDMRDTMGNELINEAMKNSKEMISNGINEMIERVKKVFKDAEVDDVNLISFMMAEGTRARKLYIHDMLKDSEDFSKRGELAMNMSIIFKVLSRMAENNIDIDKEIMTELSDTMFETSILLAERGSLFANLSIMSKLANETKKELRKESKSNIEIIHDATKSKYKN